jgi:peroxiredoxin/predicted 2-oxoglutarate/Fe(II)-dependent dioxygenase YbiX
MVDTMTLESSRAPPAFGEPAPYVTAATDGIPNYALDVAAGRWILLMVFGSLAVPACAAAHEAVLRRAALFNDADAAFFGVSVDPSDRKLRGLANHPFGLRYFWDFDHGVSQTYGLVRDGVLKPAVFLIDRGLRIACAAEIERTGEVLDELERQLRLETETPAASSAPALVLPRIFEPEFCADLVTLFRSGAQSQSGFAAVVGGRTLTVLDTRLKRRQDVTIADEALKAIIDHKLVTRLFPIIRRALGWTAEYIERHLIVRYGEADGGFFSAHRDDVTPGTAHRKFAVSLALNEDYDGGELRFPEFGARTYRAPLGGAVVFACSLLHEVAPVSRGGRYAFLPFLYDAEGALVRAANLSLVGAAD